MGLGRAGVEGTPEVELEGVKAVTELELKGTAVAGPSMAEGGGRHVGSLEDEDGGTTCSWAKAKQCSSK
jgi:hypothetical protein